LGAESLNDAKPLWELENDVILFAADSAEVTTPRIDDVPRSDVHVRVPSDFEACEDRRNLFC